MGIFKQFCNNIVCFLTNKNKTISDEEKEAEEYTKPSVIDSSKPETIDYELLGKPVINNIGTTYPNLLMMDDKEGQFALFDMDFENMSELHDYHVNKEYNIIRVGGKYAGFIAHNYLKTLSRLDVAVLDMNLEASIKLRGGRRVTYDGIDIAIEIKQKFPNCKILFCTAHRNNRNDKLVGRYIEKFEDDGSEFDRHYFHKDDYSREEILYKLLRYRKLPSES